MMESAATMSPNATADVSPNLVKQLSIITESNLRNPCNLRITLSV
jgi:hypothetical protein